MKIEEQFLTKSKFTKLIEKTVADLRIPYMDAIIKVCETNDIEIEDIKDGGLAVVHLSTAAYGQRLQTVLEAAAISTSTAWPSSSGYFSAEAESATTPIIYFSGMPNNDVRASARALIGRLYEVSGMRAGFAKAVPPAMEKVLEDLLGEIAGDHEEALSRGTP